jgi:aminoglycoside phosphotransferase (APT) family kinase protein
VGAVLNERVLAPIASHIAEWEVAHVELDIYGTDDARRIAEAIADFCRRELGCTPAETLFYQSSIGAVIGVRLLDDRRVVIKAHQPDIERQRLDEVVRLQSAVARGIGLAPNVLRGPAPLGQGFATVEEYVDRGSIRNGHEPAVRCALARSLNRVVEHLAASAHASTLPTGLLSSTPANALWPRPHSKLFDFDATHRGAEYIDEIAAAARARMMPAGRQVIGHSDWRAEHVRFEGDRPVVAFDWDSLCKEQEPALVGSAAHMFCANWSRSAVVQSPTLEEAREFVAEYETAAGRRFTQAERVLCGAAFAYAVAYTSRCGHAAGVDTRAQPGTFHHLIATHGTRLLDL